jgi:hypothetical protein
MSLTLFDVYGKEVNAAVIRNSNSFVISRSGLAAGIYFYNLLSDGSIVARGKLVVE